MKTITQVFQGEDLHISREQLEALGAKPGDRVVIRPQRTQPEIDATEKARRRAILEALADAWSEGALDNFETERAQMWQSWTQKLS